MQLLREDNITKGVPKEEFYKLYHFEPEELSDILTAVVRSESYSFDKVYLREDVEGDMKTQASGTFPRHDLLGKLPKILAVRNDNGELFFSIDGVYMNEVPVNFGIALDKQTLSTLSRGKEVGFDELVSTPSKSFGR